MKTNQSNNFVSGNYAFASLLSALALTLVPTSSLAAPSQVELNQKNIFIGEVGAQQEIMLTRTSNTPKEVELTLEYEAQETYCAQEAVRIAFGPHISCGPALMSPGYCPPNRPRYRADIYEINDGHVYPGPMAYRNRGVVQPLASCNYEVRFCAREDVRPVMKTEQVEIKFKKTESLSPGQAEKYELTVGVSGLGGLNARAHSSLKSSDAPSSYRIQNSGRNEYKVTN